MLSIAVLTFLLAPPPPTHAVKCFSEKYPGWKSAVGTRNFTTHPCRTPILSGQEGNDWISDRFTKPSPFIVGRLSMGAELCLLHEYRRGDNPMSPCKEPHKWSGIYPETDEMLRTFSKEFQASIRESAGLSTRIIFPPYVSMAVSG